MRALDINDRLSLYNDMVGTSKEKFVRGFNFVRCKKPGGEWIVTSHLNVVAHSKKELAQEYPASTTDRETEGMEETLLDYEYEVYMQLVSVWGSRFHLVSQPDPVSIPHWYYRANIAQVGTHVTC